LGYYQNRYANWFDYAESEGVRRTCDFCGGEFTPASPNQKRHRRNPETHNMAEDLTAAACEDERWKASLSRDAWIRRILGYSPEEFIELHGMKDYLSL
jgi:hypothetical protein